MRYVNYAGGRARSEQLEIRDGCPPLGIDDAAFLFIECE